MHKVNQDVSDGLKVVSPALLNTQMSVNWRVSRSSCQASVLFVWYVLMSLNVSVLFAQAEIDAMQNVWILSDSNQEIFRFYVSVDVVFSMKQLHFLNLGY